VESNLNLPRRVVAHGAFYCLRGEKQKQQRTPINSMYAVIRHYHFDPKDSKAIDENVTNKFIPIIKKAAGFVRYYWLDNGNGEGTSFSVFSDKKGAEDSVRFAADWVSGDASISALMKQKPEIIEGTVVAHD
jgi:hypothetical protein